VTEYRLVAQPQVDLDISAAFDWYDKEQAGLGREFLGELRATYYRVVDGPLKYQPLRSGIRRALVRRFPYAVYFAVEGEVIVVLAVLHVSRDPAEWQRRRGLIG
jgi:plasmid stabilization system protein ParE